MGDEQDREDEPREPGHPPLTLIPWQCASCGATAHIDPDEPVDWCPWCHRRAQARHELAKRLTLEPPDVDPWMGDDEISHQIRLYALKLADGLSDSLITAKDAQRALQRLLRTVELIITRRQAA